MLASSARQSSSLPTASATVVPSQAISVLNSHSESHLLSKLLRSQMPDTCRERVFETCLIYVWYTSVMSGEYIRPEL